MPIAEHSVPRMLSLVSEDLGLPVLDRVYTGPLLDPLAVQDLIIPSLHGGDDILKTKPQVYQLVYLWHWEAEFILGMKNIHMKSCTVLSQSLERQGSFVTPVS